MLETAIIGSCQQERSLPASNIVASFDTESLDSLFKVLIGSPVNQETLLEMYFQTMISRIDWDVFSLCVCFGVCQKEICNTESQFALSSSSSASCEALNVDLLVLRSPTVGAPRSTSAAPRTRGSEASPFGGTAGAKRPCPLPPRFGARRLSNLASRSDPSGSYARGSRGGGQRADRPRGPPRARLH